MARDDTVIWDVRSPAEHAGDDPRQNKRGGPHPGRGPHGVDGAYEPPVRSGLLLPADEMRRKLEAIGITPDKRVLIHCQAGIRAAHGTFLLRLMGYDQREELRRILERMGQPGRHSDCEGNVSQYYGAGDGFALMLAAKRSTVSPPETGIRFS